MYIYIYINGLCHCKTQDPELGLIFSSAELETTLHVWVKKANCSDWVFVDALLLTKACSLSSAWKKNHISMGSISIAKHLSCQGKISTKDTAIRGALKKIIIPSMNE